MIQEISNIFSGLLYGQLSRGDAAKPRKIMRDSLSVECEGQGSEPVIQNFVQHTMF